MAITLVQSNAVGIWNASIAFDSDNTAGNTLVCFVQAMANNTTAVNDTQGNTWVECGAGLVNMKDQSGYISVWICVNCKAGANTVTQNGNSGCIHVAEFSGVDSSNTIDGFSSVSDHSGSGSNNINAGTITPDYSGDLFVVWTCCMGGPLTAGTGFTASPDGDVNGFWEYQIGSGTSAVTGYTTDGTTTDDMASIIVALKSQDSTTSITKKFMFIKRVI